MHSPTPWRPDQRKRYKAPGQADWDCISVRGFALSSGEEVEANSERIVAAINFFHGRDIPTDRIPEGGFWEMADALNEILDNIKGIQCAEEGEKMRWARKIEKSYRSGRDLLAKLGIDE